MSNEILLIGSLFLAFGLAILSFKLFGKLGIIAFMCLAIIASNIEVLILVDAYEMEQTLGNIMFASTFLVTDIISELYGKKEAKKVVHIGIYIALAFTIISQYWLLYTPSVNDWAFSSISTIFYKVPRITFASLVVMAICQRFDVWLYHKIWVATIKKYDDKSSMLWLRNNGSTLITQAFNAILFTLFAFAYTEGYDFKTLVSIMLSSYIIFVITSLSDTPFVYWARYIHENRKNDIE